ncbi:MAG: 30S ribosomal protein S8 [Sorangiineae bacterium NIC37A_2]|jgi:small subunit ribosomal protein S8|nr:MAG: 30S ribosomal protein S8 [Sorangiineae bacterium NIC37A_2]
MMTDPISDMLARLRNAAMARHDVARIPASRIKKSIAELLQREGYISSVSEDEVGPERRKTITVVLKYGGDKSCAFAGIRRVSKPGRRVYVGHSSIPRVLNGLGVSILSTSHGLMTDKEARQKKVGGELLCEVW